MPRRPPHRCAYPGCATLIYTTSTKCERHGGDSRAFYQSPEWRGKGGIRQEQLERQPLCQWPGCSELATDVDHVNRNTSDNRPENLRSYCHSHHGVKTAYDQQDEVAYDVVAWRRRQGRYPASHDHRRLGGNRASAIVWVLTEKGRHAWPK